MIHFTRHFSFEAAQRKYGDLSRRYRGNAQSDVDLTVYEGREKFERDLAGEYAIDYKRGTLTPKETK